MQNPAYREGEWESPKPGTILSRMQENHLAQRAQRDATNVPVFKDKEKRDPLTQFIQDVVVKPPLESAARLMGDAGSMIGANSNMPESNVFDLMNVSDLKAAAGLLAFGKLGAGKTGKYLSHIIPNFRAGSVTTESVERALKTTIDPEIMKKYAYDVARSKGMQSFGYGVVDQIDEIGYGDRVMRGVQTSHGKVDIHGSRHMPVTDIDTPNEGHIVVDKLGRERKGHQAESFQDALGAMEEFSGNMWNQRGTPQTFMIEATPGGLRAQNLSVSYDPEIYAEFHSKYLGDRMDKSYNSLMTAPRVSSVMSGSPNIDIASPMYYSRVSPKIERPGESVAMPLFTLNPGHESDAILQRYIRYRSLVNPNAQYGGAQFKTFLEQNFDRFTPAQQRAISSVYRGLLPATAGAAIVGESTNE